VKFQEGLAHFIFIDKGTSKNNSHAVPTPTWGFYRTDIMVLTIVFTL
jgi:hypothetical protein